VRCLAIHVCMGIAEFAASSTVVVKSWIAFLISLSSRRCGSADGLASRMCLNVVQFACL
jgi:hypothetical protein